MNWKEVAIPKRLTLFKLDLYTGASAGKVILSSVTVIVVHSKGKAFFLQFHSTENEDRAEANKRI
uniref:hypothetical protein n=1 Tax=Prevotella sp. TaxID=59823 RepID=UPI003FEDA480